MKILETLNLTKTFGGITALSGVNIYTNEGEIVGLIGPNGSGKTTLFNCISGFCPPDKGKILLEDNDITNHEPYEIAYKGLSRTFQITRVFQNLSVLDNLLAAQSEKGEKLISTFRKSEESTIRKALELLEFVDLIHLKEQLAGELSYGQQKLVELARGLMRSPKILLLDEPTAGVNPTLIQKIMGRIVHANEEFGKTFLIIEHNMDLITDIAHRVYALNRGNVIAEGSPQIIKSDINVIEAYLGG
jgi:branched-chain amino acid transport system ATP-binding protein